MFAFNFSMAKNIIITECCVFVFIKIVIPTKKTVALNRYKNLTFLIIIEHFVKNVEKWLYINGHKI